MSTSSNMAAADGALAPTEIALAPIPSSGAIVKSSRSNKAPKTFKGAAPVRVLDGFGRAVNAQSYYAAPKSTEEVAALFKTARDEGLQVAFRGSGRSYGDASLNASGLALDMTQMNRCLSWDPQHGIIEVEPGVTIEGLWRRSLADGYWPAVVPGTMRPTMGGVLAMNVHGKNNFKVGPSGDHVLDFDLLTPAGDLIKCSREENADLFYAAIGGLGLLGATTRIRLKMKKVESGYLRVKGLATRNLDHSFDVFERELPGADYLVGWIDGAIGGASLGRGQLHVANYISANEDPDGPASFHVERQTLPNHIMGVPKSILWPFMGMFMNNLGVRFVNGGKWWSSWLQDGHSYLQSHVGFAFLLDYVPNWRLAYGSGGFIQYQIFVPKETARQTMRSILEMSQKARLPNYLSVLKRHRPDKFLLTHAVDGWSMAMDFACHKGREKDLAALVRDMTNCVLEAGGRFYMAKDAVIQPGDATRYLGADTIRTFAQLKARTDPDGLLSSNLGRRVFGDALKLPAPASASGTGSAGNE